MNTNTKIIIATILLSTVGITAYIFTNRTPEVQTIETQSKDYSDIYDKIETETQMKSVEFDNMDDMVEYTNSINTISGVEEVTEFIKIFFNDCQTNSIPTMLTYYDESIWDYVIDNEAFPFYDESETVVFKPKNISVEEEDDEGVYTVKYTLEAILSSTGETIAEIKREDTFKLYKDFEVITIKDYIRNTIDHKYY